MSSMRVVSGEWVGRAGGLFLVAAMGACASIPPPPPTGPQLGYRNVGYGTILDAEIEADPEQGGFKLVPGPPWPAPFAQGPDCLLDPTAANVRYAQSTGAKPVRVKVPGLSEPLYGLLSLCGAPPEATGASVRELQLQVPRERVEATADGRVSVVWGAHLAGGAELAQKAWILYLSRTPLHFSDQPTEPMTAAQVAQKEYEEWEVTRRHIQKSNMTAFMIPTILLCLAIPFTIILIAI
jgi:hypothetical protein